MEKEEVKIRMDDFFKEKEVTKRIPTDIDNISVSDAVKASTEIPADYAKVVFDSLGKLGTPPILHFRNYKMEEIINLATVSTEEAFIKKLVYVLNQMVWEKYDCAELHEHDLETVMITLYAAFWGKEFTGFEYTYEDTEVDEETGEEETIEKKALAILPIKNIKTIPLKEEFKEPIKITSGNRTAKFRLQRIKDIVFVSNYIEKAFFEKKRFFSDYEIEREKKLNASKERRYQEYMDDKGMMSLKVLEALLIEEIDGIPTVTIEEKLNAFDKLDINFWIKYNSVVQKYGEFGVNPEVKFFSVELGEEISRRFPFQLMDFLPSMELQDDSDYTVSFGD